MRKFALLIFSIIIAGLNAIGNIQENTSKSKIDSLESILKLSAGIKKINTLNDLSYLYLNVSPQKSIEYGDSALILSIASNNKNEQIIAIGVTGLAYYLLDDNYKNSIPMREKEYTSNQSLMTEDEIKLIIKSAGCLK